MHGSSSMLPKELYNKSILESREADGYRNYLQKLFSEIVYRNYLHKLFTEIIYGNCLQKVLLRLLRLTCYKIC